MAGLSRRTAVKLVLSTGVLASAGAGVYHFTSGGQAPIWSYFAIGAPNGELVAEQSDSPALSDTAPTDLDAMANAWRNAPAESAPPESFATTSPPTTDRYAIPPDAEPSPDEESTSPTEPVTRGQEPIEAADSGGSYELSEPQSFDAPTASTPSSDRAREAFGSSTASAAERYGAAADSHGGPETVNPFGAVPQAAASAVRPPAASEVPMAASDLEMPQATSTSVPIPSDPSVETGHENLRSANAVYGAGNEQFRPNAPTDFDEGSLASGAEGTGRPGERALEGLQKPAVVIQKTAPPEIQVGTPAKFTVQVRNVGNQTAENVTIRDEIPQGTIVIGTTPKAETSGPHLIWQLGALSTGEERTLEVQLMPQAEGEIGSVATVSYEGRASAKARCTMPQLAIRMTAPAKVMIGQEQRVKIELRNPGTGDAKNVMLFENVPESLKHAAGPALEFEVGTLRAGETREMELVLTAERAGPVVNTLSARADGNLQVQQQVEFEVIAPELAVNVEGPERRYLERPATYQVTVENPGTAPAHDVELVTKLPKGMKFVRANNMGEYDATTHSIYWSLAQLPEGERGTVELVAMPLEPGQQTLTVEGKAQQGLSDATKQDVLIEGLAAIMFEVRDAQDPIEVGRETSYEIRVVNQGTKAASNVQVVVTLPTGMQAVSADGETRYSIQAGGVVFEPLPQLAPKADTVYRVQVKGIQPGDQRVTVQVNTDDISQPIRREESTRVFGDE